MSWPKLIRTGLLLLLGAFILYIKLASPSSSSSPPAPVSSQLVASGSAGNPESATTANEGVPQKAVDVLKVIRSTGEAPEGYVGGRVFENREGRLASGGDYREFDVDPHNGQRNAERLIVEWKTKKAWYTGDHYQTFTELP